MENIKLELSEQEVKVILALIDMAVKAGVPSMGDANNALVVFNKLASKLPQPAPQEADVEEITDEEKKQEEESDK